MYDLYKRIKIVFNLVSTQDFVNKNAIFQALEFNDIDQVSIRTIQRDFKFIETSHNITIKYSRSQKAYYLDQTEESQENIAAFKELIQKYDDYYLFMMGVTHFNDFKKSIYLETKENYKGSVNIDTILRAINQEKKIHFTKENYNTGKITKYTVSPLKLKEFDKRWYVLAVKDNQLLSFGLARISDLQILDQKITINPIDFKKAIANYQDVIGLYDQPNDDLQKVVLKLPLTQLKYLQSLKWHHSQKCHFPENKEEKGYAHFLLKPNEELKMKILALGSNVEVVQPKSLRLQIAETIKQMNKIYKN